MEEVKEVEPKPAGENTGTTNLIEETSVRQQVTAIFVSGLVLLVALVWNHTFISLFNHFVDTKERFIYQLIYAVVLSFLLFGLIYLLLKRANKKK